MDPQLGLEKNAKEHIVKSLQVLLASTYALFLKTQNFHWNVVSPQFFSLHIMFEKQYEELDGSLDEMAERIRALGSFVEASFTFFVKHSLIHDETSSVEAISMVRKLLNDHETVIRFIRKELPIAEKAEDGATADFLNKRLAAHEKTAWMLRSHL